MIKIRPLFMFTESGPEPGPSLPPYTIRLKFTEGVTPTFAYGTGTQVSSSPNVWDLYHQANRWNNLLFNQTNLIEVLGANLSSNTWDLMNIFNGCSNLTTVALFDTSNILSMANMFYNCSSLTAVPLFNTSQVTNMTGMLYTCTNLTSLPLIDTSSVTYMNEAFYGCVNVQSGALALYQQASQGTVSNHTRTFTNCGSNTTTGAAELAQIPSDWK